MADRCISPLSNCDAGSKPPRKNVFCDTHPLRLSYNQVNVIFIIGQITTQPIHSLYNWAITPYTRLTHSPLSGGCYTFDQIVQIRPLFMHILLNRYNPCAWGVCCCYLETLRTMLPCTPIYTNVKYILLEDKFTLHSTACK